MACGVIALDNHSNGLILHLDRAIYGPSITVKKKFRIETLGTRRRFESLASR
ncbi:hypothetical protein SAY87_023563 [Trapa incisa]|nr:hypothetical protein SAY87_023563 [Trapa incisa]